MYYLFLQTVWNRTFYLVGWIFAFLWHIAKKYHFIYEWFYGSFFLQKRPISLLMAFQSGLLPIFYSFWYQSCIRFQALDQSESKRANLLTKAIFRWSFNCHFRIAGWLFDLLISKFHSIYWLLRGWMNASFYFSSYSPPTQTPIRSYRIEPYSHAHKCWWWGVF